MKDRKFTLKLVFIVIIGLACVVFILKFRQAKKVIENQASQKVEKNHSTQNPDKQKSDDEGPRSPQAEIKNTKGPLKKLVPSNRDLPFDSREKRTEQIPLQQLGGGVQLKGSIVKVKGKSYSQVENVYAIPKERKDEFNPEDVLYERGPYTIVKSDEGVPRDALNLAYNHRTKRLGVITGQLIVKFTEKEAYENRFQNFSKAEKEVAAHPSIKTSILLLEGAQTLEDLKKRGSFWGSLPGIKAAEVEVLEAEILLK